ncbi:MAG: isomerase [Alphaproteobacteria bacterium]|nr:isomerase [Alphaproteobacteria bacterium]
MEQYQKNLLGHAMLVLVIGLLAGFMLAFSLIGGLEILPTVFMGIPVFGTADGWVRAHSGGILNALLMVAIAFALPHCGLAMDRLTLYAKGTIFAGWANTVFYWFGNASANRALSFTDNTLGTANILGTVGYLVAVIAALVTIFIAAQMARGFLSKD